MTQAADQFKHQFDMLLRDTIKPEISDAMNALHDESSNPSAELKQLGEWAAERLKAVVEQTADVYDGEQEDVMDFVQSEADRGAFDD